MTFSLLELALPGREIVPIGVILYDEEADRLGVRLHRDCSEFDSSGEFEEELFMLAAMESEIKGRAVEDGATPTLAWLEQSLGNVLRIGERNWIDVGGLDFDSALQTLFAAKIPECRKRRTPAERANLRYED